MAVESVDRSSQSGGSDVRAVKESYDERERDLQVKHRQEMADLQRKHQKSVESLKTQYDQALGNLRDGMRETMSAREKKHMKEVQDIQDMSRKRYTQARVEDDDKYNTTKDTLEGELARCHDKDQADQERLTSQYESDINKRDQQDSDLEEHYRDSSQTALGDQRKRLMEKSESEKNDLRKELADTVKQKDRETGSLRREKDNIESNLKGEISHQKQTLDTKYQDAIGRERSRYSESVKSLNDSFSQSMMDNKEKYRMRTEQLEDQYTGNFQNLKGSVNQRIDNELEPTKREVIALREQNYTDRNQSKHQKDVETTNLKTEYAKNFDELENRREMTVAASHQEKTKSLEEQQRRHDHNFQQQTQFFATKLNEQKMQNENNIDQKIGSVQRDSQVTKMRADQINKKIFDNYSDKTVQQEEFFDEQSESKQSAYDKRLNDQRTNLEKQKYSDINNLQNQLAKESIAHQEKLMDTISMNDKQMGAMRSGYEKKLKRQQELFHEQTEKQVKGMQMDREASESKLQARINNLKETYENELDQLRKRQAGERQDLASKKGPGATS